MGFNRSMFCSSDQSGGLLMSTRKAGLSKSRIAAFEQCAKRLWLSTHRPDLKEEDPAASVRFATGNEVGRIARDFSTGGILVDAQPDLAASLAQTRQLLADGHCAPIYEATFQHDGILIQADVFPVTAFETDSGVLLKECFGSS